MPAESSFGCRICGATRHSICWELHDSPYGDLFKTSEGLAKSILSNSLIVVRCSDCKLLQLRDDPKIEEIYDKYLYFTSVTKPLNDFYDQITSRLLQEHKFDQDDLIIDIGSNDGTFLSFFKIRGNKVLGIDPSGPASDFANKNGVKTLNEYFTETTVKKIKEKYQSPRLISINYALANIPKLGELFKNMANLMSDSTILSVVTGYHPDQFAINMFEYINHDHLTYLTLKDFQFLAELNNLKIIDCSRVEHKGGSIHVTFARKSAGQIVRTSVAQLLQRESWCRTTEDIEITRLASEVGTITKNTKEILLTFADKPVFGIGASISTTHLVSQFGLSDLIQTLFDDDPNKIGKFSPGASIEVKGIAQIPKESDCIAVILAWQHTNKILERLKQVGFTGKVFVPLPFPRFIDI